MGKSTAPKKKPAAKRVAKSGVTTKGVKRLHRGSLRHALVRQVGLKGNNGVANGTAAVAAANQEPPSKRAGWPLRRLPGSVDPGKWRNNEGKEVMVDFARRPWLPDTWAQGVKSTNVRGRADLGISGTFQVYMSPCGKTHYCKKEVDNTFGRPVTVKDGFQGQLLLAQLRAKYAKQDSDASFLKILTSAERRVLPSADEFHFCVVSARRATCESGTRDIAVVQQALIACGVTPTWYVDEESLKDYRALGLKAVVGGKLTVARNKALKDAQRMGKACVQLSDDIAAWEYRHGASATERTLDAINAAYQAAARYVVSPLAAARFILAKMRGVPEERKPKLGGSFVLKQCSFSFAGDEFSKHHFIVGDFFVVDVGSTVNFDERLRLKEDYDFTCAHLEKYGSVFRCNRMTVDVKHYSNSGGACSLRDAKGIEERRNIDLILKKWPQAIRLHGRRCNEIILKWGGAEDEA